MQKLIDRWCCNSSMKCLFLASIELHWSKILYSSQTYYIKHTDILFYEKIHWLNFISKLSDLFLLIYNTLTCYFLLGPFVPFPTSCNWAKFFQQLFQNLHYIISFCEFYSLVNCKLWCSCSWVRTLRLWWLRLLLSRHGI